MKIHKIIGNGKKGKVYWTLCGRAWEDPIKGTFMTPKVTCQNCQRVIAGLAPTAAPDAPQGEILKNPTNDPNQGGE